MSTHAVVDFINEKNEPLARVYHHYDGHEVGIDLVNFLNGKMLTNGVKLQQQDLCFAGVGDLAVRYITKVKGDPSKAGSIYLLPSEQEFLDASFYYKVQQIKEAGLTRDALRVTNRDGVRIHLDI